MGSQTSRDGTKFPENQANGDDNNGNVCSGNSEQKVR